MDYTLTRTHLTPYGIFGRMDQFYTLEHAYPTTDGGYAAKIPAGTYTCSKYNSPKLKEWVWILHDVPGASYIEIHVGNYNEDSNGCILLGLDMVGGMILHSRQAFDLFMQIQKGEEYFTLTIV